jgi:hypothetical protein
MPWDKKQPNRKQTDLNYHFEEDPSMDPKRMFHQESDSFEDSHSADDISQ